MSSPVGAGTSVTILSITSCILIPALAETSGASSAGMPITSSISSLTRFGSALGKSILLTTGTISSPLSTAKYVLARV